MKKLAGFCLFVLVAAGIFADPAEGYWISVDDKTKEATAGWYIYQENGLLYGRIVSVAGFPQDVPAAACRESYPGFPLPGKVNEMPVVGTIWIFALRRDGEGRWSGGKIVDPNNGDLYGCRITFHAAGGRRGPTDVLEMRGLIGPLGRSQFWQKSTEAAARGLR